MNCSVVIPVYNSAQTISLLIQRLNDVLSALVESFEVILVNDGSADQSWSEIIRMAGKFPWVHGIDLMRNSGQHNALLCGIRSARFEITITIDDDLQHPPEEIHLLLKKLEQGYDVVYGVPEKMPHSWWRNLGSYLTKLVIASAIRIKTIRDVSAFRAFRTNLREAFVEYDNPDVLIDVLLSWGTSRFAVVAVNEQPRLVGKSNYSLKKLIRMSLVYLTNFSTAPLRLSNIIGFTFTVFGLIGFLYVVFVYFTVGSISGFPFLASAIMVFSGVQLFALGIIGEYLARVFERSAGRRPYVVAQTTPRIPQTEQ